MPEELVTFQLSKAAQLLPWILGLFVALALGVCLRRGAHWGVNLGLGLALIFLWGVLGPLLPRDRVEFAGNHYIRRTGFWFAPNDHVIDLARVKERAVASRRRTPKGAPLISDRFYFDDGSYEDVPRGDLYQAHAGAIRKLLDERHARARGSRPN